MRIRARVYRHCPGTFHEVKLRIRRSRFKGRWQVSLGWIRWGTTLVTVQLEESGNGD